MQAFCLVDLLRRIGVKIGEARIIGVAKRILNP